jgi:hypothetical protein
MKTLKQTEQITGIKTNTLRQRLKRKKLKGEKLGRDWVLDDHTVGLLLGETVK